MNILRIIPSLNPRGGGPMEGARRIDAELTMRGHSVEVVCLDNPSDVSTLDYPGVVHAFGSSGGTYAYSRDLFSWLKAHAKSFDVAIVNGVWQYHSLAAWRALKASDTPYFVFTHGMLDPWFKRTYPIKHVKKALYWLLAEHRVLRDARGVIFTCEEEKLLARNSFFPYKCEEIVTAYGTAAPPEVSQAAVDAFIEKYPELKGTRVLLFMGRLHEKKGCDLALRAMAEIAKGNSSLRLIMAGPGTPEKVDRLRSLAESLGIGEKVIWPGMLSGNMKWAAFAVAEAFTLPSHQENFGIAVTEALACGKPVLISNKVNIWREIVEDNVGWVGNDDFEGTLRSVRNWLAASDDALRSMSVRAKNSFAARYRMPIVVDRLLEVLESGVGAPVVERDFV
ncbi:glycosyltransferase [Paraburkholderia sp. BL10I2N1]|uniref:glycosyltransferase n=1 Tax=Paraburkholderia sp. BL10I2N1 TaxID=1938796 RepID=UPI00105F9350|nr:glycosyltransferase [Paraburkholderia sp. BL10I2N1]TDN70849.1 glycosyltransferase involved in cell wall biosynthesis [Paraburkholderia sp. BL10I2N1]